MKERREVTARSPRSLENGSDRYVVSERVSGGHDELGLLVGRAAVKAETVALDSGTVRVVGIDSCHLWSTTVRLKPESRVEVGAGSVRGSSRPRSVEIYAWHADPRGVFSSSMSCWPAAAHAAARQVVARSSHAVSPEIRSGPARPRRVRKNRKRWSLVGSVHVASAVPLDDRNAYVTWIYEFFGQSKSRHCVGALHEAIDQAAIATGPTFPSGELCTVIVVHLIFACCSYCPNCFSPQGVRTIQTKGTGDGSAEHPPCPAVAAVHGTTALDHSLWPHDRTRIPRSDWVLVGLGTFRTSTDFGGSGVYEAIEFRRAIDLRRSGDVLIDPGLDNRYID